MANDDVEVKFGANVDKVDKGVSHIEKQLASLNNTVKGLGGAFANMGRLVVGAFTINALTEMVVSLGDLGEQAERTAAILGMTTEEVTSLQFATEVMGGSADQMTGMLERLARTMDAAASGGKQQVAAFKEVGVSFQDAQGNLRPLQDMLYEIADRFAGAEDGAAKTALAMELMGRSGAEAIPLLNQGSAALRDFTEQARDAGTVLTGELAHAMGETGDYIDVFKLSIQGLAIRFFTVLKPAIDAGVQAMTAFVQSIDAQSIAGALNSVITVVADIMLKLVEFSASVQQIIGELWIRASYLSTYGIEAFSTANRESMQKALELLNATTKQGLEENKALFAGWMATIRGYIGGGVNVSGSPDDRDGAAGGLTLPKPKGSFRPPDAPLSGDAKTAQNAVKSAIDNLQKLTLTVQDQIAVIGMGTAAATAYTEEHKVLAIAQMNNIQLTAKQQAAVKGYAAEVGVATQQLEYMTAVQDTMRGIAEGIAGAFGEWMNGTTDLGTALLKMTLQLAEAVAEALILNLILSAMGLSAPATGIGAVVGGLFGGNRAEGGELQAGKWYIAGEHGPEPVWGGGVGAFAAGTGGGAGGMGGPSAGEIAHEIAKALRPQLAATSHASKQVGNTIREMGRRIR